MANLGSTIQAPAIDKMEENYLLSPPFAELNQPLEWKEVSVMVTGNVTNGPYNIKQNGPFLFFYRIIKTNNLIKSDCEFLIFIFNYTCEKDEATGVIKLNHIYCPNIKHILIFKKESVDDFVRNYNDIYSKMILHFKNLRITDCKIEDTVFFSCLSNTNRNLESKLDLKEAINGEYFVEVQTKTVEGFKPKLDIKLSVNSYVEPALTAPEAFGMKPHLASIFHLDNLSKNKRAEGHFICTSIHTLMNSILAIAKWNLDITNRPYRRDSANIFNLEPEIHEKITEKQEPVKPSLLSGLVSKLKGEGKNKPASKAPQPVHKVLTKNPTPEPHPKPAPQAQPQIHAAEPKPVEKPTLQRAQSIPISSGPQLKVSTLKQPKLSISVQRVETKTNNAPQQTQEIPENPFAKKTEKKLHVDTEESNIPAVYPEFSSPKLTLATAASMSSDVVQSQTRRISYQRRTSSSSALPDMRQSVAENKDDDEHSSRIRHDFHAPLDLEKELNTKRHKISAKKEPTGYKPQVLAKLIPKSENSEKLAEEAKSEILSSLLSQSSVENEFDKFETIKDVTVESIINETENSFLDRFSTDFSFFDFAQANLDPMKIDVQMLKKPMYSECEFTSGLIAVRSELQQLNSSVTTIENAAHFIYYTASVFINGLNDKTNFVTAYKELEGQMDFLKQPLLEASAYKNSFEQASIFVQDLILSNDIIPTLYVVRNDADFLKRHYSPYALLVNQNLLDDVYELIDRIVSSNKFNFVPSASFPIDSYKDLNPFVPYMLPEIQHSIDRFATEDFTKEETLPQFIKCVADLISSGNIQEKPYNFFSDLVKDNNYENVPEWKSFEAAYKKVKNAFMSGKNFLEEFVAIGVKTKVMHIWFTLMVISRDTTNSYYPEGSIMRDFTRANHVIAVIQKIMPLIHVDETQSK